MAACELKRLRTIVAQQAKWMPWQSLPYAEGPEDSRNQWSSDSAGTLKKLGSDASGGL